MKIKTWIKYEESYLPPKCRKLRYRECEEYVNANLKETTLADMQLAFEDNSYSGKGKIYFYRGKLWTKCTLRDICAGGECENYHTPLEAFAWWKEHSSHYFGSRFYYEQEHADKKYVMNRLNADMKEYLLVDGELYTQTAEPRYVVMTFGLGHNHGGTSLSCTYRYNPNISRDSYFSANEGEKAVACANATAQGRGDTNDVGKFEAFIKVYMPELVKVKPNRQHGKGCQFLNDMESIIKKSSDTAEAGLLCSLFTLASMN